MNMIKRLWSLITNKYKKFTDERLVQKLLADVSDTDRPFVEPLIRNQLAVINDAAFVAHGHENLFEKQKKLMLQTSKKVASAILQLRGIISIQPMTTPAGLVYLLRFAKSGGSQLSLEVVRDTVLAMSRKVQAKFTLEAAQDLKTIHNIDVEAELANAIGAEIGDEYANEVVSDLIDLAQPPTPVEVGSSLADTMPQLIVEINRAANRIAANTRRGAGNYIIASPMAVSMLQTSATLTFKMIAGDTTLNGIRKVGELLDGNDRVVYTVYVSLHPQLRKGGVESFVIGYKGVSGEVDAGYVLCPYVPVMQTGMTIDPTTFQPVVPMMTRYGKYVPSGEGYSNARNYFEIVTFDTNVMFDKQ